MGDDCSRDLLQRFVAESKHQLMEKSEESDEVELNLGLSLGVESKPTRLVRSSSSQSTMKREDQDAIAYPLLRTTSLPMDSEEYRKRKELQCFKRKERTRRLTKRGGSREEQGVNALPAPRGFRPPSSQGSVGSPGTGSSGTCELECRSVQGLGFNDTRSFAGVRSVAEEHGIDSPMSTSNLRATVSVKTEVIGMEGTKEMPCVSTKRIGPNGRRVQGFLYKYKRGLQEVKIVCVCHGRFLSPAEFVKHAGGGDVPYPLREIVVDSLSS